MDTPLVPTTLSPAKRNALNGFLFLLCCFMLVTFVLALLHGFKGHGGFIVVGIAILAFLICTFILINWIRNNDSLDDKFKYLTYIQAAALILLCIGVLIAVSEKPKPCPTCPPCVQQCVLTPLAQGGCRKMPDCFATMYKNDTVCVTYYPNNPTVSGEAGLTRLF